MRTLKILGCIPVKDLPDYRILYEEGQEDIVIEKCPHCTEEIWVSIMKRQFRQIDIDSIVLCFYCARELAIKSGNEEITSKDIKDFQEDVSKN